MNLQSSTCNTELKDHVRRLCKQAGACAVGVARGGDVPQEYRAQYEQWLDEGRHAEMAYLENHRSMRRNLEAVLPGAQSVLSCAFAYHAKGMPRNALFARYAQGKDYHEVLRKALRPVAEAMEALVPGSKTRICIDSAPVSERFWAVEAGVGFIGINNCLIVPDYGSRVFLAEILWTHPLEPDTPLHDKRCIRCLKCVAACPGKTISRCGAPINAASCNSYLTIEHRGPIPPATKLYGTIYGCDICQDVCPHNRNTTPADVLPDFYPTEPFLALSREDAAEITPDRFAEIFRRSAVKRTKVEGLRRNASHRTEE